MSLNPIDSVSVWPTGKHLLLIGNRILFSLWDTESRTKSGAREGTKDLLM